MHPISVSAVESGFARVSERLEFVIRIRIEEEIPFRVEPVYPKRNDSEGLVVRSRGKEGFLLGGSQGDEYAVRVRRVVFFQYPFREFRFEERIGNVLYDFFHPFFITEEDDAFGRGSLREVFYPEPRIFFEREEIRFREKRTLEHVLFEFRRYVVGNRKDFRIFHRFGEGSEIERLFVGGKVLGFEFLFSDLDRFRICGYDFGFWEGHDFRSRFREHFLTPLHPSAPAAF